MKKGFLIALLIVCILLLAILVFQMVTGNVLILQGLNGTDGIDGIDGVDGKDGQDGEDGKDGQNGKDGTDGKSAYELAVEDGFEGSLHEWLLFLAVRGADGKDGINGTNGTNGVDGKDGVGVADVRINAQGNLIVTLTDGTVLNAGYVGGDGVLSKDPDADGFYPVYETVIMTGGDDNVNDLYLRLAPDTVNGDILTSISRGTELLRIGDQRTEDGFSRFLYNGVECYARSKFFELKYMYDGEIPLINLPDRVVLTAGEQTWFVTDQILPNRTDDMMISYSYSGDGDRVFDGSDAFGITPRWSEEASGVHPPEYATLTVCLEKLVDGEHRVIEEKTVEIVVVEKQASLALTGLILGDSRISDGTLVSDLAEKMTALNLIGTRNVRYSGVKHEGRGGWSTSNYLYDAKVKQENDVWLENPFYNPATKGFDFTYYMTTHMNAATLDFVVINLGPNDTFSKESVENIEKLIDSIHAYSASIKVLVMTEYVSPADGYYLSQTYNRNVPTLRGRQFRYFYYLSEQFEGREDEGIYLLPNYVSIDSWSDWKRTTVTTATGPKERISDVIHLGTNGYLKEAATVRSYLYWLFGK